jgi:hypothetical protein
MLVLHWFVAISQYTCCAPMRCAAFCKIVYCRG